jgi:hypothetical protein
MGVPLLERSRELGGVGNRRQRRWGYPLLEELGGGRARPRVSGMIRRTGPSELSRPWACGAVGAGAAAARRPGFRPLAVLAAGALVCLSLRRRSAAAAPACARRAAAGR